MTTAVKDGKVSTYTYDGNGLRQSKTVNSVTTNHIWNGSQIALETGEDGSVKGQYYYGLKLYGAKLDGQAAYYSYNGHGDTTRITSASGEVLASYDYDAFGNETGTSGNIYNPFRYNGQYSDEETGLIYLRARYYDPSAGRFITEDPAKDGLNWYSYCAGDPVNFVDPWGLEEVKIKGVPNHKQGNEDEYRYNIYYYKMQQSGQPGELIFVYNKQYVDKNGNNVQGKNLCWASAVTSIVEYYTGNEYYVTDIIKGTKRYYNNDKGREYIDDSGYLEGKSFELADYVVSQTPRLTYTQYIYKSDAKPEDKISFNEIKKIINRGDVILLGKDVYTIGKNGLETNGHYVTIVGYDDTPGDEQIIYNDPATGKEEYEYLDYNSYTSVIIFDSSEVEK